MTKMKYKCAIFDIDGTMIDTEKAVITSLQKILKLEKNKDYPAGDLTFSLGIPGQDTLKILEFTDIPRAFKLWNTYLEECSDSSSIFPGIESTLLTLKQQKILTGVVTSKTKTELGSQFYPYGLQKYFSFIVCADDTIEHKPHPEPLLKSLDIAGMSSDQVIYIGDSIYDMLCAKGAGVDFALALWGTKNVEMDASFKLNHPQELLDIMN
jgi:HAD superfamily hydrolase (TIGR01549 family)